MRTGLTRATGRIAALEALRGLAAAAILLFHLDLALAAARGRTPWLAHAWAGVDLFFVLSAFLLGGVLLAQRRAQAGAASSAAAPRSDWLGYAARRARRILPAYWMAIVWACVFLLAAGTVPRLRDLALVATFTQTWSAATIDAIDPVFWSLAVEVQLYLLLPLAARLVGGRRGYLWAAAIAALGLLLRWASWGEGWMPVTINAPGYLPHLAVGLAAARLAKERDLGGARRWGLLAAGVLLGALALLALPPGDPVQATQSRLAHAFVRPLLGVASALVVAWAATGHVGALASRPTVWLGQVSYSLYLLHLPVVLATSALAATAPLAFVTIALAVSLLAAQASYAWVERPWLPRSR